MPDIVRERVDELAAKLVVGDTDGEQWAALLEGVCREAETAGRPDVARIATESLAALPKPDLGTDLEAFFSSSIARMQQALSEGGAETGPPSIAAKSPVPSAPAAAHLSLGEDPEMIGDGGMW